MDKTKKRIDELLRYGMINEALELVTPEVAVRGIFDGRDIITFFLMYLYEYEHAVIVINNLTKKGYTQKKNWDRAYYNLNYMVVKKSFLHLFLTATGLYGNTHAFQFFLDINQRKELDGFINAKTAFPAIDDPRLYLNYARVYGMREKSRKASIALIAIGRPKNVDIFRIIARVVWSTRISDGWMK